VIGYVDRILLIEGDGTTSIGAPAEILKKSELVPPIVRLTRALNLDEVGTSTREVRRITEELRQELPDSVRPEYSAGDVVIKAEEISVGYGDKLAVNEISLELRAGEITALMGRNGAGKSTLLKSIVGITVPFSGAITLAGEDLFSMKQNRRSELIGYVPQEPSDLLYLTSVRDECAQADRDHRLASGTTLELLHQTLPTISPDAHPRDLSEGERLTLVLSIVLASEPAVLVMDEPTRGLDYLAKNRLMALLHSRARRSGAAILIATHDVEVVAEVADRTIFLADGEKVADGPTIDVLLASPAFAPQVAKVMSPRRWLTVADVLRSQDSSS
jgi:energy-coupling factor transport system ATP-binding protein